MSEFDDPQAQIDLLHQEAEDLAAQAEFATTPGGRLRLQQDAKRKVRQAARLRAQMEGEA